MGFRVVFLDCDGTLTRVKSSWEYIHRRLNLWDGFAEIFQDQYLKGKIDYYEFCRKDASLWRGLELKKVVNIVEEIPITPGAEELIREIKKRGLITAIISTGISFLVERVKEILGIDYAFSNELLVINGFLSGEIRINVEHGRKDRIVEVLLSKLNLRKEESVAIGDGLGDLSMFMSVGLSIGFNPEKDILPHVHHAVYSDSLADLIPYLEKNVFSLDK